MEPLVRRLPRDRHLDRAAHREVGRTERMPERGGIARHRLGDGLQQIPPTLGVAARQQAIAELQQQLDRQRRPLGVALSVTSRGRVMSDSASDAVSNNACAPSSQNRSSIASASRRARSSHIRSNVSS